MSRPVASPAPSTVGRSMAMMVMSYGLIKPVWFVFITAVCMRALGAEGYGAFTAALALANLTAIFSDLGTSSYTIREVARDLPAGPAYFTNLLTGRLVLAGLTTALALGAAWALGYADTTILAVAFAGCYVASFQLAEFCRGFFRAFEVFRYESLSVLMEKVLVIGGGVVGLLWATTAAGVLGGMAVGMAAALLMTGSWVHRRLAPFQRGLLDLGFIQRALQGALPIGLFWVATMAVLSSGPLLLEYLDGLRAAGHYGAAYRVIEALQTLSAIVVAVLVPRLSALYHTGSQASYDRHLALGLGGLLLVSIAVAIGLTWGGAFLIRLLGSGEFSEAEPVLALVGWAYPLMAATFLLSMALIAADRHWYVTAITVAGALFNVVLNLLLIPTFGALGAGYALIAANAFMASAGLWGWYRLHGVMRPTNVSAPLSS